MLDLADLDLGPKSDAGAVLQLVHPVTGADLEATLVVMGADSPAYRDALFKYKDDIRARPEPGAKDSALPIVRVRAREAALAIKSWSDVSYGGADLTFSIEEAVRLMTRLTWIADQVALFRDDRRNFFPAPRVEAPKETEAPKVVAATETVEG